MAATENAEAPADRTPEPFDALRLIEAQRARAEAAQAEFLAAKAEHDVVTARYGAAIEEMSAAQKAADDLAKSLGIVPRWGTS